MNISATESTTDENFRHFSVILAASGARDALAFLVSLTDYRFISIFRTQGARATAVVHIDRENPAVMSVDEVPADATYCSYATATRERFSTDNAQDDARLVNHAARDTVLSYCGIPILDPSGEVLGTLCHYDVVPRLSGQLDFALLLQVASALYLGNHLPPYPYGST